MVRFPNWQCIIVFLKKTLYAYFPLKPSSLLVAEESLTKNLQTKSKKVPWVGVIRLSFLVHTNKRRLDMNQMMYLVGPIAFFFHMMQYYFEEKSDRNPVSLRQLARSWCPHKYVINGLSTKHGQQAAFRQFVRWTNHCSLQVFWLHSTRVYKTDRDFTVDIRSTAVRLNVHYH